MSQQFLSRMQCTGISTKTYFSLTETHFIKELGMRRLEERERERGMVIELMWEKSEMQSGSDLSLAIDI